MGSASDAGIGFAEELIGEMFVDEDRGSAGRCGGGVDL